MASLGLVMQLAARTSGALAALAATLVVLEPHQRHDGWLLFALGLCIARSVVHRIAGRDLCYPRPTAERGIADPFDAARAYVAVGLGHAVAIGVIAARELGATPRTAAGLAAALALWPVVVGVVVRLPRFRALAAGIPLAEDRGLEGASVLMTVLGACGALSTGAIVALLADLPSHRLDHGWGTLLVAVFVLLLVRACLHMRVGLAGLRAGSYDRPCDHASRYISFALVSAVCVGGVLALFAMSARMFSEALASVAAVCSLLAAWPATVRRYFYHRQFAELLAGDRVRHRRAPDAGATALGWLLAAHATTVVALLMLTATVEPRGIGGSLEHLFALAWPTRAADLAVTAAVLGLEALTAAALIGMRDYRRLVATVYALVAGTAALTTAWPIAPSAGHHAIDFQILARWIPAAVQLAIPVATLLLVHRTVVPFARARYTRRDRRVGPPDGP
ncbi:MAG TPA: hypothetical protein VLM79_06920 [Kofleriaceae bacterium]|nr:hypothetical protein [Kofleriaceae bacterium]